MTKGIFVFTLTIVLTLPAQQLLAQDMIDPETDLVYRGAFRLPGEWGWGGSSLAYFPEGDPSGPEDGHPGSLFGTGLVLQGRVAEVNIPEPVIATSPNALPTATLLQGFHSIMTGYPGGGLEVVGSGLEYLSAQAQQATGKLYWCYGHHWQSIALHSHGWYLNSEWERQDDLMAQLLEEGMARIGYASWPRGRLFGFRADPDGVLELDLGEFDKPVELLLNYRCEYAGSVRVELPGREGYSLEDSVPLDGDSIESAARWKSGTLIRPASAGTLKARIHMRSAALYAYELKPGE